MVIKVAINGYGRIGRNILRAYCHSPLKDKMRIVAINDLGDPAINAHLTRYDTVHGSFSGDVTFSNNSFLLNGEEIRVLAQRDPSSLPWKALDIDVVLECTGAFCSRKKASQHLTAGAKKVLISAPAGEDVDATIVYGVNHTTLKPTDRIVSNASCTTNCLAPLVKPLHEKIGIVSGLMTTIHSYTNDQVLVDVHHKDVRRARSATQSLIPTKTGAAKAVGLVIPELAGKLDGFAVRVPVVNVSAVDLTVQTARKTSEDAVNLLFKQVSQAAPLNGILAYNEAPLVSVDFNHHPASSIFDATQTRVLGQLVRLFAWYDNEWAFSNRMLDTAYAMMNSQELGAA